MYRALLGCLLAALVLEMAWGDEPAKPTPLTMEQKERLKGREKIYAEIARFYQMGKLNEAAKVFDRLLRLEMSVLGEDHPEVGESWSLLANIHQQRRDFAAAEEAWIRVEAIHAITLGKTHWKTIDARWAANTAKQMSKLSEEQRDKLDDAERWNTEAVSLHTKGEFGEAITLIKKELAIRKELLGEKHPKYGVSLDNLAAIYDSQGQYDKSISLHQQALAIRKETLGEKHPQYAENLNNLATVHYNQGEYTKAVSLSVEVLAIFKESLGEKHPHYAGCLNNLAEFYEGQGDSSRAKQLFQQAEAITKELSDENPLDHARSLNNLAAHYVGQGDFTRAEPLYRQALALIKKTLGEKHPSYAATLDNLAQFYIQQGEYLKAEPLFRRALASRKASLGENHPDYATSLNNLAFLSAHQGDSLKAESLHRQALAITKEAQGTEHPSYATSLSNLAELYRSRGEFTKAEPLCLQALAIDKATRGEQHPHYATSLNNLAGIYQDQQEYAKAEPLHRQALAIRKQAFGENHPEYAASLTNLAGIYYHQGNYAQAEPLYRQSISIICDHLTNSAAAQSEDAQLAHAASVRGYFDNLLIGTRKGNPALTYALVFRLRGAITARQTFVRAARSSDPQVRDTLAKMQDTTRQIAFWTNRPADGKIDIAAKLAPLHEEYDQQQQTLAQRLPEFNAYKESLKLTPAHLQKKLPAGTVLVDFIAFGEELTAFVITSTDIHRIDLGKVEPITKAIDQFRQTLYRTSPLTGKPDDPAPILRDQLLTPLRPHFKDAKLLLICPDGPLCRLPFAALPATDETKYLIEEVPIAIMPVPRLLADMLGEREKPKGSPSLLTMGDVNYDDEVAVIAKPEAMAYLRARGNEKSRFDPLSGTANEMKDIRAIFKRSFPDGKLLELRQSQPTVDALCKRMGDFQYIHLGTHGFFAPPNPAAVRNLAPQGMISEQKQQPHGIHPGLQCGIACAGANQHKEDASGILTALEVVDLDLSKVELVVLSACDTGLGETAGGEGVMGLQRAFQLAGARSIVTSLWKVDDGATAELMQRFYGNLFRNGQRMPPLEALRQAQLRMLHGRSEASDAAIPWARIDRSNANRGSAIPMNRVDDNKGYRAPHYWAAFSLAGDWR